jgi:DNA-binding IclR family transcriptional regulator
LKASPQPTPAPRPTPPRTAQAVIPADSASPGTVKSLTKGLKALDLLMKAGDVGTTDVARSLALDKSAASRILKTLAEAGFAVQGTDRRFRSGPKLRARESAVGLPGGASIRERARPLLQRIFDATRETAHLAIRADDQVLYLDKLDTDQPLRVDRPVGTLAPLHCTALGKVLLAFADTPLPRNLTGFTTRTPVSESDLKSALQRVVDNGYATDDEEFAPGIRCVAAPLRSPSHQVVAAIGLSGPTTRIAQKDLDDLGRLVAAVAREFG